jgi:hypothetical protein
MLNGHVRSEMFIYVENDNEQKDRHEESRGNYLL